MPIRLQIKWDGTTPGLAEQRLSLASFGPVIAELLKAIRQTALMISGDLGDPSGGQHRRDAKRIDFQFDEIPRGSSGMGGCVVMRPRPNEPPYRPTLPFFKQLEQEANNEYLENVLAKFIEDVGHEANNHPRNGAVGSFLRKLPPGVISQHYAAWDGERLIAEVKLGEVNLPEVTDLPRAFRVSGPAEILWLAHTREDPWVGLLIGEKVRKCHATLEQLEIATQHSENVQAAVLYKPADKFPWRLLWIRPGSEPINRPDKRDYQPVLERWDEVLRRLAK